MYINEYQGNPKEHLRLSKANLTKINNKKKDFSKTHEIDQFLYIYSYTES